MFVICANAIYVGSYWVAMVIDRYDEPSSFIHTCTHRSRSRNSSNNKYKQKHKKSIGIPIIFIFIIISFSSFHNPKAHPQKIAGKRSMKQTTHLMIHIRFISSKEVEKKFSQKHHHESPPSPFLSPFPCPSP